MKRSEALGIIIEVVSEVTYEKLAAERAERILRRLEARGMRPPNEDYKDWDGIIRATNFNWEPEPTIKIEVDPTLKENEWYLRHD